MFQQKSSYSRALWAYFINVQRQEEQGNTNHPDIKSEVGKNRLFSIWTHLENCNNSFICHWGAEEANMLASSCLSLHQESELFWIIIICFRLCLCPTDEFKSNILSVVHLWALFSGNSCLLLLVTGMSKTKLYSLVLPLNKHTHCTEQQEGKPLPQNIRLYPSFQCNQRVIHGGGQEPLQTLPVFASVRKDIQRTWRLTNYLSFQEKANHRVCHN